MLGRTGITQHQRAGLSRMHVTGRTLEQHPCMVVVREAEGTPMKHSFTKPPR